MTQSKRIVAVAGAPVGLVVLPAAALPVQGMRKEDTPGQTNPSFAPKYSR